MNDRLPDPELDAQFYEGVIFKRLIAWLIDVVVVLAACVALLVVSLGVLAIVITFLGFAVNLAYRIWGLTVWSATIGMRVTGIELRNRDGERFTQGDAALHTGIYVLVAVSGLGLLAHIAAMLLTARGQGLPDLLLGTVAINRPAD
ncbi:MAG: RDD family protein [Pseudomonadota bacterium]